MNATRLHLFDQSYFIKPISQSRQRYAMIGTSKLDYLFIRACIVLLQCIAPLSAVYCVATLVLRSSVYRIPWPLEIWAVAETLFYLLVYLPNSFLLQRAAVHPPGTTRQDRRQLFEKCHRTIDNAELCTSCRSVVIHFLIGTFLFETCLGSSLPQRLPEKGNADIGFANRSFEMVQVRTIIGDQTGQCEGFLLLGVP